MGQKRAAIYLRVSTQAQEMERQERDLLAWAKRLDFEVVGVFAEKIGGRQKDRPQRAKVLDLARKRSVDFVLVTELSRWGRSLDDLVRTLRELEGCSVGLKALNGVDFDVTSASGRLISGVLSAFAEFEADLIAERVKSGIAAAKARGKKMGRKPGVRPIVDANRGRVLGLRKEGMSLREIAKVVGISRGTVSVILDSETIKNGDLI